MLMSLAPDLIKLGEGRYWISLNDLEQTAAVGESLFDQDQRPSQCAMPCCTTRSSSNCYSVSTMTLPPRRVPRAARAEGRSIGLTTLANPAGVPRKRALIIRRG